jgi:hypothetical protein
MRIGRITDIAAQVQEYQAFMLKEYAEALWRRRRPDSNFSGYIPFGQYAWFRRPFDKGPDGIEPKMIWDAFREVLGPVHVQLECFDRHVCAGGAVRGTLRLYHENVHLPEKCEFALRAESAGKVLFSASVAVRYHESAEIPVELGPIPEGARRLELVALAEGRTAARNHLDVRGYKVEKAEPARFVAVFDPEGKLHGVGKELGDPAQIVGFDPGRTTFVVGPHALGRETQSARLAVRDWMARGGFAVVLEQNPGPWTGDVFGTGIGFVRACQPQWSRWAMNLVRHADRADICEPSDPMFAGLAEEDMRWWNGDTFLAHDYLALDTLREGDQILSRIGNGLDSGELMPVEYEYRDSGYSLTAVRRRIGLGSILCTSLLIGTKLGHEPVADIMLNNILA